MAKPRIFVSSTYFDLKNIRADLERFIKNQGYEPILNERGHIAYGSKEKLEEYCYKEIHLADILVSIVGSRYGSQSKNDNRSISHTELKTAIDLGKQVYIFVEKSVYAEFRTYEQNKEKDISYASVDDPRIFQFIEELHSLPLNNTISTFETSTDITEYLKLQWSGLFQRLLSENSKQREFNALQEIQSTAKTLNQLVTFLMEERKNGDLAFKEILKNNHPLFAALKQELDVPYRVFFYSMQELTDFLSARSYKFLTEEIWDSPEEAEWINHKTSPSKLLRIKTSLFDSEGRLVPMTPDQWDSRYISLIDWPTDDPEDQLDF